MMNGTKTNGSARMSRRWFLSAVTDISRLEASCEPT